MPDYTDADKLKVVERELFFRRRAYPGMIVRNQITKKTADKQIAILEAIANDYRPAELPIERKPNAQASTDIDDR